MQARATALVEPGTRARGAIYPTIAQLEDEGLLTTRDEGGSRVVTITIQGRAQLEERSAQLGDPFDDFADAPILLIRGTCCTNCNAEVRQIEVGGDATQLQAAANILVQARGSLYLILGEVEGGRVS